MESSLFKNALISVSDKTGLIEFVKPLADSGMRIVSSGGTAKHLQEAGISVVEVKEQTGFPEVMDGRVKTLHPNIHMALLARDEVEEDMNLLRQHELQAFDLVIGNLYPFEEASHKELSDSELAEFIDIGGPSLLRAAAKSYSRITVITEPEDYQWIAEKNEMTLADRRQLASKVFAHVSSYDAMIASQLSNGSLETAFLAGDTVSELRYGENPQQQAVWKRKKGARNGLHRAEILQGKALSFNNLLDIEAATKALREWSQPAAVSVKHNNPCGVGVAESSVDALKYSLQADPVSVFGGIVASNFKIDVAEAHELKAIFLECVIAPDFTEEAREVLAGKKNLRLLQWPTLMEVDQGLHIKSIDGGYLAQSIDRVELWANEWKNYGMEPSGGIRSACELAWKSCAHLKSNAIALACEQYSVGMGMGQVNRVDAVDQAIQRWRKHHPSVTADRVVLASDAFFPFADSIEMIAQAGIKWVVQPGGSIRDNEVFAKANELGVNLVITGKRHFKH